MRNAEHLEQAALIKWSIWLSNIHPELRLLFAVPNGGQRHVAVASKLKAEGVKPGVPDLVLPVARNGYHGLFIELKAGKGRLTDHQVAWIDGLRLQGYKAEVAYGFTEAQRILCEYLGVI